LFLLFIILFTQILVADSLIFSEPGTITFKLEHFLDASEIGGGGDDGDAISLTPNQYQQQQQPQQQPQQPYNIVQQESRPGNNVNQFQSDDAVCGVPVVGQSQSLVIGGQAAARGQWPWLVAFYRSAAGNLEFICGGSLLTASSVLVRNLIEDL